jgi:hypothetical protein
MFDRVPEIHKEKGKFNRGWIFAWVGSLPVPEHGVKSALDSSLVKRDEIVASNSRIHQAMLDVLALPPT